MVRKIVESQIKLAEVSKGCLVMFASGKVFYYQIQVLKTIYVDIVEQSIATVVPSVEKLEVCADEENNEPYELMFSVLAYCKAPLYQLAY